MLDKCMYDQLFLYCHACIYKVKIEELEQVLDLIAARVIQHCAQQSTHKINTYASGSPLFTAVLYPHTLGHGGVSNASVEEAA